MVTLWWILSLLNYGIWADGRCSHDWRPADSYEFNAWACRLCGGSTDDQHKRDWEMEQRSKKLIGEFLYNARVVRSAVLAISAVTWSGLLGAWAAIGHPALLVVGSINFAAFWILKDHFKNLSQESLTQVRKSGSARRNRRRR